MAALLLQLAIAAPALSGDKPFAVVIADADGTTPSALPAGSEGTLKATYTNLGAQQQLGSSNLVVPSALRIVGATVSQGGATVSGNTILLRNLNLAPGGSLTVTMRLAAGCAVQTLTWAAPVTKQANNYNGPPGNDLNIDLTQSRLTTVVTGGCALRFVPTAQPANARAGQTITAQPYTPAGPPVAVEVVDAGGGRVVTNDVSVTMAIGTNAGGGTLSGTRTATTAGGVATFSTLSIDRAGSGYTLQASSASAGSATSTPFAIAEVGIADLAQPAAHPERRTRRALGVIGALIEQQQRVAAELEQTAALGVGGLQQGGEAGPDGVGELLRALGPDLGQTLGQHREARDVHVHHRAIDGAHGGAGPLAHVPREHARHVGQEQRLDQVPAPWRPDRVRRPPRPPRCPWRRRRRAGPARRGRRT